MTAPPKQLLACVRRLLIGESTILSAIVTDCDWERLESLVSPGIETIERFTRATWKNTLADLKP